MAVVNESMFGRVEFVSKKFKVVDPHKTGAFVKPKYNDLYRWLSQQMNKVGIDNRIIDLDGKKRHRKKKRQYLLGNTIIVESDSKYQLVCGWIPSAESEKKGEGVWSLEIFKKRKARDIMLFRNRLNKKDRLVCQILGFLDSEEFSDVRFLSEQQVKRRRRQMQGSKS